MKKSLFPILGLICICALIAMADDSLFEGISMNERLLISNQVNKSWATFEPGVASGISPDGFQITLMGTNNVGKILIKARNVAATEHASMSASSADLLVFRVMGATLMEYGVNANQIQIGSSTSYLQVNATNLIFGQNKLIFGPVATPVMTMANGATTSNFFGFTERQTITASNFVQSVGSAGGFVGNGSGLTNLTIPAGSLPASVLTNLTTTVPWLTWSGQGTRVMNLATNSTAIGVANGGTGTGTTFTQGSVVFADGSGVYAQDNGNFFWDNTNKRLGLGVNTSLLAKLHTVSTNGVDSGIFVDSYSSTATQGASIVLRRAEGTFASPTAVLSGDLFGSIGGRGYGATGFTANSRSKIHYVASENWTDTAQGSRIEFYTTSSTTTNTIEAMRIHNDGSVGIGTNAIISTIKLAVTGTAEIFGGAAAIAPADGQNNFVINGSTNGGLGYIQSLGGRAFTRTVTATNYTLGIGDYYLGVNATNNLVIVTLPAATALPSGVNYQIVHETGTNATISIVAAGSDTISGLQSNLIITTTSPSISAGRGFRNVTGNGTTAWTAY